MTAARGLEKANMTDVTNSWNLQVVLELFKDKRTHQATAYECVLVDVDYGVPVF